MNKNAKGFTLLEVLIALGIVSVISILSWQGLQEVLRSANRVTEVDEQIQTVAAVFSQFEKRPWRAGVDAGHAHPGERFD